MNNEEVREAMQLQIDAIKEADEQELNAIVEELTRLNALPRTYYEKSKGKQQNERYKKNMQNEEWRKKSMLTIEQEPRQLEKALGSPKQRVTTRKSGRNLNEYE